VEGRFEERDVAVATDAVAPDAQKRREDRDARDIAAGEVDE